MNTNTSRFPRGNFIGASSFGSFAPVGDATQFAPAGLPRLFLALEVGEYCQLSCRHCIYHAPQTTVTKEAPRGNVVDAVAEFLSKGDASTWVSFAGKEPTVYPSVLAQLARQSSARSGLTILMTNGLLLRGELLQELEQSIGLFDISVDGDQPAHDWMRGSGMFAKTMERVEDVLQRGYARVGLIATAVHATLPDGRKQIDSVVSLARDLKERFGDDRNLSLSVSLYYDRPGHSMLLTEDDLTCLVTGLRESGMMSTVMWTANYAHLWPVVRERLGIAGMVAYDTKTDIPVLKDSNVRHLLFNLTQTPLLGMRVSNDGDVYLGCNHLTLGHEAQKYRIAHVGTDELGGVIKRVLDGTDPFVQRVSQLDDRCLVCTHYEQCRGGDSLSGVYFSGKAADPYCSLLN